jgi:hypothetical protein
MGTAVWFADAELDGQFTRTLMAVYAGPAPWARRSPPRSGSQYRWRRRSLRRPGPGHLGQVVYDWLDETVGPAA